MMPAGTITEDSGACLSMQADIVAIYPHTVAADALFMTGCTAAERERRDLLISETKTDTRNALELQLL